MEDNKTFISLNEHTLDMVLKKYLYSSSKVIDVYNEFMELKRKPNLIFKKILMTEEDKGSDSCLYYRGDEVHDYNSAMSIAIYTIRDHYDILLSGLMQPLLNIINRIAFNDNKFNMPIKYEQTGKKELYMCVNYLTMDEREEELFKTVEDKLKDLEVLGNKTKTELKKHEINEFLNSCKEKYKHIQYCYSMDNVKNEMLYTIHMRLSDLITEIENKYKELS